MSQRVESSPGLIPAGVQARYHGNYHLQSLTVASLRTDHECLRRLLRSFEAAASPMQRRDVLRLAIDLFDTHTQLEHALPGASDVRDLALLFDLIELIEMTDPASKLYIARGMEFKIRLEAHLNEEDARPVSAMTRLPLFDEGLLHFRDVLLERADAHFRRHAGAGSATALAA
jgi:hypothetical protein